MIYCILNQILLVIFCEVWAINKIHKAGPLRNSPPRGFNQVIKEYNISQAGSVFNDFNFKYAKKYENNDVKGFVFNVFRDNLRKINHLNLMAKTSTFMMNEFTSMTIKDFTEKYTGYNSAAAAVTKDNVTRFDFDRNFNYSENKDFREDGLLMVRHQHNCSNSYVHSAVGKNFFSYFCSYRWYDDYSEAVLMRIS